MDKAEFLKWSRKYEKDQALWAQTEQELGARFRRTKLLTSEDLALVVEWKFKDQDSKRANILEAVAKNDQDTYAASQIKPSVLLEQKMRTE